MDRIPHPMDNVPHPVDRVPHPMDRVPHPMDRVPHPMDRVPHPTDCTTCDEVLDLSQSKVKQEEVVVPAMNYTVFPLTPPHICYPAMPIPLRYPPPIMTYTMIAESSDDASDKSSVSPPVSNAVTSTFMMANSVINTRNGKPTRPFKAYPKDLLGGATSPDVLLGSYTNDEYLEFRRKMLSQIQTVSNKSNANMKRSNSPQQPSSTGEEDARNAAYWERRRKNNEAAKRSRDARRAKEDEIAIRAAFLEQENIRLKYDVAALRKELSKLRCLIYNR